MRFKPSSSPRGKLQKQCDDLLSKIERTKRGHICEVHNRKCPGLGASHILSKRTHPKLRYVRQNILICGWFCSHFYKHHDNDDPRAQEYDRAIERKLGKQWRDGLLMLEATQPKHNMTYLNMLKMAFNQELKEVEK